MPTLLGERIRQARARKTMRQSDLAKMLGISRSAVANWESGDGSRPSLENLSKIAIATDCGVDWLATGRGAPTDEILALRDIDIVHESDERELLRLYRKSRPGARRLLLQMLAQHVALES